MHKSGKVRYFGVSNYTAGQIRLLKKAVRQPIVANQIHLGLGYPGAFTDGIEFTIGLAQGAGGGPYLGTSESGTLDYCRLEDIQIQAWSPLRSDLLNPKLNSPPGLKAAARKLSEVANAKHTTASALALAWLLHHPAGIVPIIGATKPEHVVEDCTADFLSLTNQEWYDLLINTAGLESRAVPRT